MEEFTNPEFSFVNEPYPSDLTPRNSKYFEKDLKKAYESECKYNQTLLREIEAIKEKEKELIAKNEKDNKDLENLKDEVGVLKENLLRLKEKTTKRKLENKKLSNEISIITQEKKDFAAKIEDLEASNLKIFVLKHDLESFERKITELNKDLISRERLLEKSNQEKKELEKLYSKLLDDSSSFKSNDKDYEIQELYEKKKRLEENLDDLRNNYGTIEESLNLTKMENLNLKSEKNKFIEEKNKFLQEYNNLNIKIKELKMENDSLNSALLEKIDQNRQSGDASSMQTKNYIAKKENEIRLLSKELSETRFQVERLENALKNEEKINQDRSDSLEKALKDNAKIRRDFAKVCEENSLSFQQIVEENNNYLKIVSNLQDKNDKANRKIEELEEIIEKKPKNQITIQPEREKLILNIQKEKETLKSLLSEKESLLEKLRFDNANLLSNSNLEKNKMISEINHLKTMESSSSAKLNNLQISFKSLESNYNVQSSFAQTLKNNVFSLTEESSKLRYQIESLNMEKNKINSEVNKLSSEKMELKNLIDNYKGKSSELEIKVSTLEKTINLQKSEMNRYFTENEGLNKKIAELRKENECLQNQITLKISEAISEGDIKVELSHLKSTINCLNEEVKFLQNKNNGLEIRLHEENNEKFQKEKVISSKEIACQILERKLETAERRVNEIERENSKILESYGNKLKLSEQNEENMKKKVSKLESDFKRISDELQIKMNVEKSFLDKIEKLEESIKLYQNNQETQKNRFQSISDDSLKSQDIMRKYKEELSSRDFTIKSLEADILNNQAEINRFKQENENLQKKILTVLQVGNSEKERQLTDMQKYMDGDREELNQIKEKYRKLKLFSKKILEENQKNQRNSEKLSSKMKKSDQKASIFINLSLKPDAKESELHNKILRINSDIVTILKKFEKMVLALQTVKKEVAKTQLKNIFSEDITIIRSKIIKMFKLFCVPDINRCNLLDFIQISTNGELEKEINNSLLNSLDFLQQFNNVVIKYKHQDMHELKKFKSNFKYDDSKENISIELEKNSIEEKKKLISLLTSDEILKIKKLIQHKKEESPDLIDKIDEILNGISENYVISFNKINEILEVEFKESDKNVWFLLNRLRFLYMSLKNVEISEELDFKLNYEDNFKIEINNLETIESD